MYIFLGVKNACDGQAGGVVVPHMDIQISRHPYTAGDGGGGGASSSSVDDGEDGHRDYRRD